MAKESDAPRGKAYGIYLIFSDNISEAYWEAVSKGREAGPEVHLEMGGVSVEMTFHEFYQKVGLLPIKSSDIQSPE